LSQLLPVTISEDADFYDIGFQEPAPNGIAEGIRSTCD
jgi:hypothetical protein